MIRTTILVTFVSFSCVAQSAPRGWKPSMERLSRCVDRLPSELQMPLKPVLADLNTGLSGGFLKQPQSKPPVPPSYVTSLDRDAELCEYALARVGTRNTSEILSDLRQDLETKTYDCREHGWYRNVKVQVQTLKDGKPSPGWEIFYLWLPGKHLPALQKLRFKSLSPAEETLPPGLYSFQARKKNQSSDETRVAVVAKETVLCEIPVP